MWRIGALAAALAVGLFAAPAAAAASDRAWVEYLADRLAEDPVYVSDHVAGEVPPADRDRIASAVEALGVPTYVAVVPAPSTRSGQGTDYTNAELVTILHDRIGADGVYVVTDASGIGAEARAYGYALPVEEAATAAWYEAESGEGAVATLERFAEIATSGAVPERLERARASADEGDPWWVEAGFDETRNQAFLIGTALGLVGSVALIFAVRSWYLRSAVNGPARPPRRPGARPRPKRGPRRGGRRR